MMSADPPEPLPRVLVVDDDARLLRLLERFLGESGFAVTGAPSAEDAREILEREIPDILVLDVMMPGESGLDLTAALNAQRLDLPILLLSAKGEAEDRLIGLELGADDYLPKPFEPRELVLRLRRMLRRRTPEAGAVAARPVRFGPFLFDPARQVLTQDGEPVHLTPGEAALLAALARRPGLAVDRDVLTEQAGLSGTGDRAVDVQMTRLRRKIEPEVKYPRFLQTVRGRGYRLMTD